MLSNVFIKKGAQSVAAIAPLSRKVKGLMLGLGTGIPLGMDWIMRNQTPFTTKDENGETHVDPIGYFKEFDATRTGSALVSAGVGASLPLIYKKFGPLAAITTGLNIPLKDLIVSGNTVTHKASELLETLDQKAKKEMQDGVDVNDKGTNDLVAAIKSYKGILGILGAGALGIGAASLIHKMRKKDKVQQQNKGRIKYIIPGKKGDPTTYAEVDVPIDSEALSQTMQDNISSNIRRQALKNIKANQRKRDPETGKLISNMDYETKYNVDVDGDGEIGNPFDKKPTDPSDSINRYMYKK